MSIDTVKRAAYRMSGNASIDIGTENGFAACTVHFGKPASAELVTKTAEAFRLEVLDQDLRAIVAAEDLPSAKCGSGAGIFAVRLAVQ